MTARQSGRIKDKTQTDSLSSSQDCPNTNMADVANVNKPKGMGTTTETISLDTISKDLHELTCEMKRLNPLSEKLQGIEKRMEKDKDDI